MTLMYWNCFNKCWPLQIYAISKVVFHCILIAIDWVINYRSSSLFKLRKYRRPLKKKKKLLFAKAQEANRKDVEHAFGVLQARFAIMRGLARFFDSETLWDIMKACITLHNMIIEDERDVNEAVELDYEQIDDNPTIQLSWEHTNEFAEFIETHQCIQDHKIHSQLQSDLI